MKLFALICFIVLAGCSSKEKAAAKSVTPQPSKRHPLAKYVELAGFRLTESAAGKLNVKFSAINHSDADLGDLTMKVRILTNQAAPTDPPVTEFEAKIPSIGPQETKDVTAKAETKLRVYELPDWQFMHAEFDITSPKP